MFYFQSHKVHTIKTELSINHINDVDIRIFIAMVTTVGCALYNHIKSRQVQKKHIYSGLVIKLHLLCTRNIHIITMTWQIHFQTIPCNAFPDNSMQLWRKSVQQLQRCVRANLQVDMKQMGKCPWRCTVTKSGKLHRTSNRENPSSRFRDMHSGPWASPYTWCHQMETFSALLDICAGNSPVSGEFPAQRPVTRSFDIIFDVRLNKQLSKQSWGWWFEMQSGSLWRHCNVSRQFHRTLHGENLSSGLRDVFWPMWGKPMWGKLMWGKWHWTTTYLENSIELWMEQMQPAVSEICISQSLDPHWYQVCPIGEPIWGKWAIDHEVVQLHPDSKVHGANMGPTWGRQDPDGPHVGHMNLAIWAGLNDSTEVWMKKFV